MVKRSATSKFPIARKVAQATPVVICTYDMSHTAAKALELFMQDIVASAVEQTRKTGGKRVAPYHLYVYVMLTTRKRAALTIETFDFLKDIVEKVADPLESGGAARSTKRRKVAKAEEADEASADDSAD